VIFIENKYITMYTLLFVIIVRVIIHGRNMRLLRDCFLKTFFLFYVYLHWIQENCFHKIKRYLYIEWSVKNNNIYNNIKAKYKSLHMLLSCRLWCLNHQTITINMNLRDWTLILHYYQREKINITIDFKKWHLMDRSL